MRLAKSTFIIFYFMGLVPIGLVRIANLNVGLAVVIFILLTTFLLYGPLTCKVTRDRYYAMPSAIAALIPASLLLSYLSVMFFSDVFTSKIVVYVLNYMFFWVLLHEIKSYQDIDLFFKRVGIMLIAATGLLVFFYFRPDILDRLTYTAGMGTFRGYIDGFVRIFTPGMTFMGFGAIFFLARASIGKDSTARKTLWATIGVTLFLLISFINSVRTDMAVIFTAIILLFFYRFNIKKILYYTSIAAVCIFALVFFSKDTYSYLLERAAPFISIQRFDPTEALQGKQVSDSDFGTYYWRLNEAHYVVSQLETLPQKLFGVMGEKYMFDGVAGVELPHMGVVGIYFELGLLGLLTFLTFIIFFSLKLIRLVMLYRGDDREFLTVFMALSWMTIIVSGLANPVFFNEKSIALVAIAALATIMAKLHARRDIAASVS